MAPAHTCRNTGTCLSPPETRLFTLCAPCDAKKVPHNIRNLTSEGGDTAPLNTIKWKRVRWVVCKGMLSTSIPVYGRCFEYMLQSRFSFTQAHVGWSVGNWRWGSKGLRTMWCPYRCPAPGVGFRGNLQGVNRGRVIMVNNGSLLRLYRAPYDPLLRYSIHAETNSLLVNFRFHTHLI